MADSKFLVSEQKENCFYSKMDDEIQFILDERNSKNTKRATRFNLKTFTDYLSEENLPKIEDLDVNELPTILQNFYPNLRRVDGKDYKLQSIKCICAGINRWTKANRNLDIITDPRFTKANEIFKGVSKIARQTGRGATKSYPVIEPEDLECIATYFLHDVMNNPDPRKVQKCVLFYIIYFFVRRGRENLYEMNLQTFEVGTDPDGRQYIFQAIDEFDKNHTHDCTEEAKKGRMYERPDSDICPVAMFKLYKSKLHHDFAPLWQRPKMGKIHYTDTYWYDKQRVGHEPLERYMKTLCIDAKLSAMDYTNHSIRATCITLLDRAQFEARHIIAITGHRSEATIKQYAKGCSNEKKRQISLLATNILPKIPKICQSSKPSESAVTPKVEIKPDFDINNLDLFPIDKEEDDILINFLNQNPNIDTQEPTTSGVIVPVAQEIQQNFTTNSVQNVQNIDQNIPAFFPRMYFPGSSVTINYNVHQK